MPLAIWLPSKYDIPLIGQTFMQLKWVHYLMSWGGMIYDLAIPFLLLNKKNPSICIYNGHYLPSINKNSFPDRNVSLYNDF